MGTSTSLRTVFVILLSAGLIFAGSGLFQTMLPIRAELEAFSTSLIGLLGAAYFAGFVGGCVIGPGLIKAVGHVRAFAGVVSVLAAIVLLFPLWVDAVLWIWLRFLTGICLAIVIMAVESWLNDQASNENRGRMLSLYIIITNGGWIVGQLGINLADIVSPTLFIGITVLICLSAAPIALTPSSEPSPVPDAGLQLGNLFILSPVGTMGCFLIGTAEGAFWSLGPLFGQLRGLEVFEVSLLMGAFVLGGTLSQWPVGRLSDSRDRRVVILPVALATGVTGLSIALLDGLGLVPMLLLAMAHGALMIPLYPLCLAHVNDSAPSERLVQVSGGLLLVYSIGATLGPLLAAPVMEYTGPGGLFVFISVVLVAFGAMIAVRMSLTGRRIRAFPTRYIPSPRTTQSIYELESDRPGDD